MKKKFAQSGDGKTYNLLGAEVKKASATYLFAR